MAACVGGGRQFTVPLPEGPCEIPSEPRWPSAEQGGAAALSKASLERGAGGNIPKWGQKGQPRAVLANLFSGVALEATNRYLLEAVPQSTPGSSWFLHKGDHDFAECILTTILWVFGDKPDVLYPETRRHVLDVLLLEEGGKPALYVPNTLGLVLDTENHHLMRESSRYLKNQWLFRYGNDEEKGNPTYDNAANGLEEWMVEHLQEILDEGIYEFNAVPYLAYTVQPLLNLEAFPESEEVRARARRILDKINWQYALGSLDFRRCAPFRRQIKNIGRTDLSGDPHTGFMRYCCGPPYDRETRDDRCATIAAAIGSYCIPAVTRQWAIEKPKEYFVQFGRGPGASPELYSGGPDYLISAGGVSRGARSLIISRPTTLVLRDKAKDISGCFSLPGRGAYDQWNNTGVHRRFACSNAPVKAPAQYEPAVSEKGWTVYEPACAPNLQIATYNAEGLGLLMVFSDGQCSPQQLAKALNEANPGADKLRGQFTWPNGGATLTYEVNAPKGTWVMAALDGAPLDRDYDAWPQLNGDPVP